MSIKNKPALMSSNNQKWETPPDLIQRINAVYPVDLDLCAARPNVATRFYSEEKSCFDHPWDGVNNYANPEYGQFLKPFSIRFLEQKKPDLNYLFLTPARVDTQWWRNLTAGRPVVCFIKGRLKFGSLDYWFKYWEEKRKEAEAEAKKTMKLHGLYYSPHPSRLPQRNMLIKAAYKGIPKNGKFPPQPAPFPSALIYHGRFPGRLLDLMRELGEVWTKA